jgi:hypothetical protein
MRVNLMVSLLVRLAIDLDTSISNVESISDSADGIRVTRLPLGLTMAPVFGATHDSNSTELTRKCLFCLRLPIPYQYSCLIRNAGFR